VGEVDAKGLSPFWYIGSVRHDCTRQFIKKSSIKIMKLMYLKNGNWKKNFLSIAKKTEKKVLVWCVVGGCYTHVSILHIHQCLLGLLVSAPSLLCEGCGFESPLGRGEITLGSCHPVRDFSYTPCTSTNMTSGNLLYPLFFFIVYSSNGPSKP
jgi:hypothetical protein